MNVLITKYVQFKGQHYEIGMYVNLETEEDKNLLISKGKAREDLTPLTKAEIFEAKKSADNSVDYVLP